MTFKIGDIVKKSKGYNYPGVIVSVFDTTAGDTRYVVEATGEDYKGMLHIFNEEQLELSMTIKAYKFLVNSEKKQSMCERVSFEDIVNIAYPQLDPNKMSHMWTITYSYIDRGRTASGSMQRGEKVFLHEGMIFTCLITSGN